MPHEAIHAAFKKIYLTIFSILVVSELVSVLQNVVGNHETSKQAIGEFFQFSLIVIIPIFVIVILAHVITVKVTWVRLSIYYGIWIGWIFPYLDRFSKNPNGFLSRISTRICDRYFKVSEKPFLSLILHSKNIDNFERIWSAPKSINDKKNVLDNPSTHKPVFIKREHLMDKGYWNKWTFAEILLFNKLEFQKINDDGTRYHMEVDLTNQSYGVYNTAGKFFIIKNFQNDALAKRVDYVEDFLKGKTNEDTFSLDLSNFPLRWASGGSLPIVHWKNEDWFVFVFRMIPPVGLNVANGGSETKDEYKNINSLMMREFLEEIILLDREPDANLSFPIHQRLLRFPDQILEDVDDDVRRKITSEEFIKKHASLRSQHDGMGIEFDAHGPSVERVNTPFELHLTYHEGKKIENKKVGNIVYSINPRERGIECLSINRFKMDDNNYLLFGEIWELENALMRNPIILISCDFMKDVFNQNGGNLGRSINDDVFFEGKMLSSIPSNKIKIFDKDIEFRKKRVNFIQSHANPSKEMTSELTLHKNWLNKYEKMFDEIRIIQNKNEVIDLAKYPEFISLLTLCPVTWRSIELAFTHNLI